MGARWELPLRRDQVLRIVKAVGAGEEAQFVRDAVDAALAGEDRALGWAALWVSIGLGAGLLLGLALYPLVAA